MEESGILHGQRARDGEWVGGWNSALMVYFGVGPYVQYVFCVSSVRGYVPSASYDLAVWQVEGYVMVCL